MLPPELVDKIKRIEITAKHLVTDVFAGEYHSAFKGRGMEFDEVRLYYPGDDVRRIDWNVTARMAVPYVRRYHEERELTVMLVVDASGSAEFGTSGQFKRELAAELAAVVAFAATTNNDRVGLVVFSDVVELLVPPKKGRRHVLRLIRDLLVFRPQNTGTDIALALDTVNLLLKRRSIVFLVSDFIAPAHSYSTALTISARRHDLIAVDMHDPAEREMPRIGLVTLEDAETGDLVWVDTDDEEWRRSFDAEVRRLEESKTQVIRAAGVDRISVTTGEDYVAGLNEFFRRRARRAAR